MGMLRALFGGAERSRDDSATQQNTKLSMRFIFLAIMLSLLLALGVGLVPDQRPEFVMGAVIGIVVCVLVTLLYIIASGFSALGLTDRTQALGLPDGSIRALIALLLIVTWIGLSLYLFNQTLPPTRRDGTVDQNTLQAYQNSRELAQQLITTMGTLVVAVAGFYFGTRSAQEARDIARKVSGEAMPIIYSLSPNQARQNDSLVVIITGENLRRVNKVQLQRTGVEIIHGTNILTSDTTVQCRFKIDRGPGDPPWDLYVETEDEESAIRRAAFSIV